MHLVLAGRRRDAAHKLPPAQASAGATLPHGNRTLGERRLAVPGVFKPGV
ncbi:hypothetical protein JCM10135_07320 [Stetteria hydrogenophila]